MTDPDARWPSRHSIRLGGFDYSTPGAYFINVCTQGRTSLFGEISDGVMHLNDAGLMVADVFRGITDHYPTARAGEFVVMPNHFRGIVWIVREDDNDTDGRPPPACDGRPQGAAPTMSLPDIVERFKSLTTHYYIQGVRSSGWPPFAGRLWQRNYFERIVRFKENNLQRVREYIANNPARWDADPDNPLANTNSA